MQTQPNTIKKFSISIRRVPSSVNRNTLLKYFSAFGQIRNLKFKKNTRREHRSAATLDMKTEEGFLAVLRAKPHVIHGLEVVVQEKLSKGQIKAKNKKELCRKIYICNFPLSYTTGHLETLFEGIGRVSGVSINSKSGITNPMENYGFVTFESESDARKALDLGQVEAYDRNGECHVVRTKPFVSKKEVERQFEEMAKARKEGSMGSGEGFRRTSGGSGLSEAEGVKRLGEDLKVKNGEKKEPNLVESLGFGLGLLENRLGSSSLAKNAGFGLKRGSFQPTQKSTPSLIDIISPANKGIYPTRGSLGAQRTQKSEFFGAQNEKKFWPNDLPSMAFKRGSWPQEQVNNLRMLSNGSEIP